MEKPEDVVRAKLADWATRCAVPLLTTTKLLTILRNDVHLNLPAQASTLLKMPKAVDVSRKSGK